MTPTPTMTATAAPVRICRVTVDALLRWAGELRPVAGRAQRKRAVSAAAAGAALGA